MGHKHVKLSDQEAKYFHDVDTSILRWSMDMGKARLSLRSMEETLATLYQSRNRKIAEMVAKSGVDPSLCSAATIDTDGVLHLELREAPEAPPAGPPA